MSQSFDTSELPWTDFSDLNGLPENSWTAAAIGGSRYDQLFVIGGVVWNVTTDPLVFTFDTGKKEWSRPDLGGSPPIRRREFQAVTNSESRIFCFGGLEDKATTAKSDTNTTFSNEMTVLDTLQGSWVLKSTLGAPLPRADSTAILLSSGHIVYLGGRQANGQFVAMNEAWIFDTKTFAWTSMKTTGKAPQSRNGHSAALTTDGRIILYGGINFNSTQPNSDVYILNTATSPYEWSQPKIENGVTPRAFHTATMVKNFMVVAFGIEPDTGSSSSVYILDASDKERYVWVTKFNPDRPLTPYPQPSTKRITLIIGFTVGSVCLVVLAGAFAFIYYKCHGRNTRRSSNPINYNSNPEHSIVSNDNIYLNHDPFNTTPPRTPTFEHSEVPKNRTRFPQQQKGPSSPLQNSFNSSHTPHSNNSSTSSSFVVQRNQQPHVTGGALYPVSSDNVDQTERASDQPEKFFINREVQQISVPRQSLFITNP
ncbi:hypothetical protein G9A89_014305 [Geosiphon pyriformis]|nr:hypothetical protein G9A89_014305 [Geosiphon pyriformis]